MIYDIFHVSLLKQDTTDKERVNKNAVTQLEFEAGNNEEYKVERIQDSAVHLKESKPDYLSRQYYLVSWKSYLKEVNTWKPASAIQHVWKLLNKFHQKNPDKSTVTFPPVDSAPPMAKPIFKPIGATKQKRNRPAKNGANKKAKKT